MDKAIEIMNSPDVAGAAEKHLPTLLEKSSFAQLRTAASRPTQLQAAAYLQMQGKKFGSKMLSALAVTVSADAFGKVKKMIKDMIMKLHEEANNEADHKAFCDTELGTNKQTREQKSADVDELTAMVEENTAKMQQLQEEVERLMGEVSELDATMQEATEIRRSEKAKNTAVVQDAKVAVPAVERAMQVLKDFYEKASQATSFSQLASDPSKKSGPAGDAPDTFGSTPFKGSSDSGGIVGMLEVILSDFQRLIAETEEDESMGLKEYEKLMAESTKDKAVKNTNIDHKKTQNTDLQVKTQEAKKDLTSAHEELAAANEYFERLKPSCVDEGINYEEKVARRKEEIQSLKEALQILG